MKTEGYSIFLALFFIEFINKNSISAGLLTAAGQAPLVAMHNSKLILDTPANKNLEKLQKNKKQNKQNRQKLQQKWENRQ